MYKQVNTKTGEGGEMNRNEKRHYTELSVLPFFVLRGQDSNLQPCD